MNALNQHWQEDVYSVLRDNQVSLFCYVPDAGHKHVIQRSIDDPNVESIALTTEEEGVAMLAGADLGGQRAVLLMQSSGLGNCVNFLSIVNAGHFPLFMMLSMRGDYGEGNPWQYPMGQATRPVLDAMGILKYEANQATEVGEVTQAALTSVFTGGRSAAVLLTQKLIGAKAF